MRVYCGILFIALFILAITSYSHGSVEQVQQATFSFQNLTTLNNNAYNFYRQQISAAGPGGFFVLVIGERIILVINGKIAGETQAYDDRYRLAQSIVNIPVGIYSVLHHELIYQNRTIASPAAINLLQQYLSAIPKAQASLKSWFGIVGNASTAVFTEEAELLKKSYSFLNTTLRTYKVENQTLFNWAQELGLLIPKIAAKTAQSSVIVLHQRFKALLNSFNITRSHPDWSRFRVVLGLEPNIRINSMFEQYFARFIGERDYLGRRLITMDLPTQVPSMLNQVSTLIVDNLIGRFFNSNPLQYRRDWLTDPANRALDQILEQLPEDPNAVTYGQIIFYTVVGTCSAVGITIYVIGLSYMTRQYNLLVQEEEERNRLMIKRILNSGRAEQTTSSTMQGMHDVPLEEH